MEKDVPNLRGEPLSSTRREALKHVWEFAKGHFAASRLYKADQVARIYFGISSRMVELAITGKEVSRKSQENLERGIAQLEMVRPGDTLKFDREQRINSLDPHDLFEVALWDYERSNFRSALGLLDQCLRVCDLRRDDHCRAKALRALGSARSFLGDHHHARVAASEAVRLARKLNDKIGLADAYEGLAWVELQRGEIKAAEEFYNSALQLGEISPVTVGSCEYGIGRALLTRAVLTKSGTSEAESLFTRGFRTFGPNRIGKGNCSLGLALCNLHTGQVAGVNAAEALFNQARDHYQFVSNDQGVALCTLGLAFAAAAANQSDRALERASTARLLFETAANDRGIAESLKIEAWAKECPAGPGRRALVVSETWWQI